MASLLQAQVEITTLFGNIHDLLYPSKSHTLGLMRRGEYTKYLDDSVTALFSWKNTWTSIKVAPHLKCTLDLLFEYLRLYIHAFAFQAVVCRRGRSSKRETLFPDGVIASPDGRHVYLAIDAAKNLVALLNDDVDPVKHLRYFPVRFYL